MKAGTLVPYALPSISPAAGSTFSVNFRDIPKKMLGAISHLVRLHLRATLTQSFSAGTMNAAAMNQCIQRFDFFDGYANRFSGGYNLLRVLEVAQDGKPRSGDPEVNVDGQTRYINRVMEFGPRNYAGAPSDFEICVAHLEGAQINGAAAALADYGGTVTVATQTHTITAWLSLRENEVRIPPVYEVKTQNVTGGFINLAGAAAYDLIAALNSTSYDAFSAGDLANISLDLGKGQQVTAIDAGVLGASFIADKGVGAIGALTAEPASGTDINQRMVSNADDTILATATASFAPVLWSQTDQQITKLPVAESIATVKWSGTQTGSTPLISGRFLPQSEARIKELAQRAVGSLGMKPTALKVKTLSKDNYAGAHLPFMPWALKLAK